MWFLGYVWDVGIKKKSITPTLGYDAVEGRDTQFCASLHLCGHQSLQKSAPQHVFFRSPVRGFRFEGDISSVVRHKQKQDLQAQKQPARKKRLKSKNSAKNALKDALNHK